MKFLVIEGLDGSGKSTQIMLMKNYFEKNNIKYEYLHFPRTDSPIYGELIARFLRGELGENNTVNPYLIALIYAGDRNDAAGMIQNWLNNGSFVLLDRYVISNIAFQCAKLKDTIERTKLKDWILDLEYSYNELPVPDLNIFLDVPFEFTTSQLTSTRAGEDRNYLLGNRDIHEDDLAFQKQVREVYLSLENKLNNFKVINCSAPGGTVATPTEIFNKILKLIF